MVEQVAHFVATEQKMPLPAPLGEKGLPAALRRNFFATPFDSALSIFAGIVSAYVIFNLLDWALFTAVFFGADRAVCVPAEGQELGACWAFVGAKFAQFLYGLYPVESRWRVDIVALLLVLLVAGLAIPKVPYKRWNAIILFAIYPFVSLVLLTGGRFAFAGGQIGLVFIVAAAATLYSASGRNGYRWSDPRSRVALYSLLAASVALIVAGLVDTGDVSFFPGGFSWLSLFSLIASLVSIGATIVGAFAKPDLAAGAPTLFIPFVAALALVVALNADLGMQTVRTNFWGGLMLTMIVAVTGIAASFPLGILLALGRRSKMPAVKLLSVVFIEFWRGVPLITVLFMAQFMLPLFMPTGVSFDQLLRALVGVALFSAAYMAEVIRGGLQAIPKGQYEGADAVGLTYWQKMRMVVLPQALKLVIPGIVNTFIGLFKDTSLVYIIGLADFLGTVRRGFSDPAWITESTPASGLVFAAFVYWVFCFSMSRYSVFMERRLDTGHKR